MFNVDQSADTSSFYGALRNDHKLRLIIGRSLPGGTFQTPLASVPLLRSVFTRAFTARDAASAEANCVFVYVSTLANMQCYID